MARCEDCGEKNITKAYRSLCDACCNIKQLTPCSKEDGTPLSVAQIVSNNVSEDMYDVKEMKRCSKCTLPTMDYALKPLTDDQKENKEEKQDE